MKYFVYGRNVYFDERLNKYIFNFCFQDPDHFDREYDLIIDLVLDDQGNLSANKSYLENNRQIKELLYLIFNEMPKEEIDDWFLSMAQDYLNKVNQAEAKKAKEYAPLREFVAQILSKSKDLEWHHI